MKSMYLIDKDHVTEAMDICEQIGLDVISAVPEETEIGILWRLVTKNLDEEKAEEFSRIMSKLDYPLYLKYDYGNKH